MAINTKVARNRLEQEKKRLLEQLDEITPQIPPADERREGSPFGKREEEATEVQELEKRLAIERRLKAQLAEIDHALFKIEKGTYGKCDVCGLPIDPARLEALPQANLCLVDKAKSRNGSRT